MQAADKEEDVAAAALREDEAILKEMAMGYDVITGRLEELPRVDGTARVGRSAARRQLWYRSLNVQLGCEQGSSPRSECSLCSVQRKGDMRLSDIFYLISFCISLIIPLDGLSRHAPSSTRCSVGLMCRKSTLPKST